MKDKVYSEWPDEILQPQGLVGEFAKYITDTAVCPQPKFSLGASLAVFGVLLGRGVKDVTGQYTNLYTFALGYSSSGKNDPRRAITQLLQKLQRDKILAGQVCSDSAEEILLNAYPVRFHILDEVGHYFGSLKTAGQNNPHLKSVMPMLTEVWSSASRDGCFIGKSRCPANGKEWKPPVKIPVPIVGVYATGSPSRLYEALSFDDLLDGALPRYLTFASDDMPEPHIRNNAEIPAQLLQSISDGLSALGLTSSHYAPEGTPPEAVTVSETEDATLEFSIFNEVCHEEKVRAERDNDPVLYLYGKAGENARRVALIQSCMRNPHSPQVTKEDADFGINLVKHSVCDMVQGVRRFVGRNQRERDSKAVENVIRKAGVITGSDLSQKLRSIDSRDRQSILLDLCEMGVIDSEVLPSGGKKPITRYRWVGAVQE